MDVQRKAVVATVQEELAEAALEQRVAGGEKALSVTEFTELIALADSLRQYDQCKSAITPEDGLAERIGGSGYSVATAYEVAQELGIDADYIERAQKILFPTVEEQLTELRRFGAHPSIGSDIILHKYQEGIQSALQAHFLGYDIRVKESIYDYTLSFSTVERKKFWPKKRKIAALRISNDGDNLYCFFTVDNPVFFRACERKLQELQKFFKKNQFRMNHNFTVRYLIGDVTD